MTSRYMIRLGQSVWTDRPKERREAEGSLVWVDRKVHDLC